MGWGAGVALSQHTHDPAVHTHKYINTHTSHHMHSHTHTYLHTLITPYTHHTVDSEEVIRMNSLRVGR